MSLPLILTPDAEADLAEAKAWYERHGVGLGDRFVACVEECLDRIRRLPEAAPSVVRGVRRAVVARFPYAVLYRVDPEQLSVLAVYHHRRHPRGWRGRV